MTNHTNWVLASHIREATREEVERFWADGWVSLPGLLSPTLASDLLRRAQELMGSAGDRNPLRSGFDFDTSNSSQPFRRPSATDPLFSDLTRSPELGRNAARLLGRDSATRFFDDALLVKLPLNLRPDRGQELGWHADTNPTDRTWLSFWIALDRVRPDQGGVRYLSGSHRLGPMWRGGACIPMEEAYEIAPRLRSCPMSNPVDAEPGDVIAHCSNVVHGTDANLGTATRWVHRVTYFPADAVYMGVPSPTITERGIHAFEILDHPGFPVVYEPTCSGVVSTPEVRRFHSD